MNDLISRREAIDAVADALKGVFVEYQYIAEKLIGKLPSAEPEIIRCKDCIKCGFCGDNTNLEIMGFNGFCSRAERRTNNG